MVEATRELAGFVARARPDDLPPEVLAHAGLVIADTVGAAVRGACSPEVLKLAGTVGPGAGAVVLQVGFPRTSAADAVLVNAIAASTTELDEGTRPTGHPAIHVLPPALARAQERGVPGAECVAAIVLGYEVQARITRASRLRGRVHCHGNLGHAGAAAAVAKLAGWPEERIVTAMTAAAALSCATSYSLCHDGATVRNAAPAASGTTALTVERLVAAGFTGYEGSIGEVFGEILGDAFDPAALVDGLGDTYAIETSYVKFHATCGHAHPVLDALGDALAGAPRAPHYPWAIQPPFAVDEIKRVTVTVSHRGAELGGVPERPVALAAKFSIPFAAAAFLVHVKEKQR